MVQLLNSSASSKVNIKGLYWKGTEDLALKAEPNLDDLPSPYLHNCCCPQFFFDGVYIPFQYHTIIAIYSMGNTTWLSIHV